MYQVFRDWHCKDLIEGGIFFEFLVFEFWLKPIDVLLYFKKLILRILHHNFLILNCYIEVPFEVWVVLSYQWKHAVNCCRFFIVFLRIIKLTEQNILPDLNPVLLSQEALSQYLASLFAEVLVIFHLFFVWWQFRPYFIFLSG